MRFTLAVCAALTLASSAAAAGPAVKLDAAGNSAARSSLLSAATLGTKYWKGSAPGKTGLALSCRGWQPSGAGIVETGAADVPALASGSVTVSQMTSVYGSTAQADTLWRRAVQPGLLACVRETVEAVGNATTAKITVKVLSQGPLTVAKVGPLTSGYRVVADLTSKVRTLKLYFDVVLVGRDATLSEISISSFGSAVPATVEHALAKIVYDNIGAGVA